MKNQASVNKTDAGWEFCLDSNVQSIDAAWLPAAGKSTLTYLNANNALCYLTTMEADLAMLNWFKALAIGGELHLQVPDSNYYAQMWLDAQWNETTLRDTSSKARQAFTGLFGPQQTGNPRSDNYDATHGDVFKSAYNHNRLQFLLQRAGFVDVQIESDGKGLLTAEARKTMDKGERQVATDYANIRKDHLNRYEFAAEHLRQYAPEKVLDLACGIGYGTLLLSEGLQADVTGVDIDANALAFANEHFNGERVEYINEDARKLAIPAESFDAIVSFETVEHVDFDQELIGKFYQLLKPGGVLIFSTPNQDVMPFDKEKFRFHLKHYTKQEIVGLLRGVGFEEHCFYTQKDPVSGVVEAGENGSFFIVTALKGE